MLFNILMKFVNKPIILNNTGLGLSPKRMRAAAPHSAPARMPGVYVQGLYKDAKPAKHTQPFMRKVIWDSN